MTTNEERIQKARERQQKHEKRIKRAREMKDRGHSIAEIADVMGLSATTVRLLLRPKKQD